MQAKFEPLEKKNKKRLTLIEIKFVRRTAGTPVVTTIGNEYILEELKVGTADKKLRRYKPNWLRHATE
jgi:hypothetical protein